MTHPRGRPQIGNTFALHLSHKLHVFVKGQAAKSGLSMGNWIRQLIICAMRVEQEGFNGLVRHKADRHERRRTSV